MNVEIPDHILEQGLELLEAMESPLTRINNVKQNALAEQFNLLCGSQFLEACVEYRQNKPIGSK